MTSPGSTPPAEGNRSRRGIRQARRQVRQMVVEYLDGHPEATDEEITSYVQAELGDIVASDISSWLGLVRQVLELIRELRKLFD